MKVASIPNMQQNLVYLHDEKTLHERGETFEVKQVREVAEHTLSGLDYWYKKLSTFGFSKSLCQPHHWRQKSPSFKCHHYDGAEPSNGHDCTEWIPTLDPRPFKMHQLGKTEYQSQDQPSQEQQAVSVICAMNGSISSTVVPSWLSILSLKSL